MSTVRQVTTQCDRCGTKHHWDLANGEVLIVLPADWVRVERSTGSSHIGSVDICADCNDSYNTWMEERKK